MAKIIGTAAERIGGELMPQVCRGTIAEDIRDKGFPFRILFVEHDGDFPMHAHEYAELVVVLGGQAEHRTEFESHRIERGDVFVITGVHMAFKKPMAYSCATSNLTRSGSSTASATSRK